VTTGPQFPAGPEAPAPPPGPPGPPAEPRKTSGFAIASLVFGIIGGVFLSLIFGIVALRRIRSRNLKGRGLAIAGLVLSGLWVLLIGVVIAVGVLTDAERDEGGRVKEMGSESVFDLRAGDCANDLEETDSAISVEVTPCAQPHDAEVISSFDFPDGDYPGTKRIFRAADRRCGRQLEARASSAPAGTEPFYFYPTEQSWAQEDDRRVTCVALFAEPRRGSLVGR
jgi:hypothetical protein